MKFRRIESFLIVLCVIAITSIVVIKILDSDTPEAVAVIGGTYAANSEFSSEISDAEEGMSEEIETKADDEESYDEIVNINTASEQELKMLDGIGDVLAGRIVEYRETYGEFTCVEDIMLVNGIGEGVFNKIVQNITV